MKARPKKTAPMVRKNETPNCKTFERANSTRVVSMSCSSILDRIAINLKYKWPSSQRALKAKKRKHERAKSLFTIWVYVCKSIYQHLVSPLLEKEKEAGEHVRKKRNQPRSYKQDPPKSGTLEPVKAKTTQGRLPHERALLNYLL